MIHESEIRLMRRIEIAAYLIAAFLLPSGVLTAWAYWGN